MAPDPQQGATVSFGNANVSLQNGAFQRTLAIDPNQHASCNCGCGCKNDNNQAGQNPPGLTYGSNTVNPQPILQATLTSDPCSSVPSLLQAQLTWNGTPPQDWVTFDTTGHQPGDVYVLPLQVANPVASNAFYSWSIEVQATVNGIVYTYSASGSFPVVVNSGGSLGNGWMLGGTYSLLFGNPNVALIDNSTGGFRLFTGPGPIYTSPANDQGTLVQNSDGTYTYTYKNQLQIHFDSTGRMISEVDPHGLTQSFAYGSPLSAITQPDGGVATFTYSNSLLASIQLPGNRSLTPSYDSNKNMTGFIDAAGGVHTFAYDTTGRLVNEQVGPLNTTYTYSPSNGTLIQIDRGLGTKLSLTAAATQGLGGGTALTLSQAVTTLTDGLGNVTTYTLDSLGRPTQLQTADGAIQKWALNAAGNPTSYVDQLGRTTTYTYNASQDRIQATYPDGTSTTYQYDPTFHQVTQIQDALNNLTTFAYDGTTSDLLAQTDALGNMTSFTWSNGLKQTTTDALGRVTTLQWDSTTRRETAEIDALGNITSYNYDSAGNQISIQDALGRYTTMSYDGNRQLLTQMDALGGVQSYTYDAAGNQLTSVDQLGRTTSTVYDQRGLPMSVTEAVGSPQQRSTTTNYDAAGNVLYVTDALGDITSYAYDALNRPIATLEAFGTSVKRTTTIVYDAAGNTVSTIDAQGTTTSYAYDVRDRQIQVIEAFNTSLQRTTTTMYDLVGNMLSTTNPRGTVTSYIYDADYRQTQQIDAYGTSLQRVTTTVYDAVGNALSMTSPIGAITSYALDALNRQTQMIEAFDSSVQRTTTTVYDAVGNTLSVTNPRGVVTSFAYDALNRRVQELDAYGTSVQRTLTTVYDAVSNVLSATNGLGVVTSFSYDALNRRVAELDAYGTSLQRAVTTVYDSDDNVIASIDPLGYATSFGYDSLNRQVSVQDAGGGIATTVYDANNNVLNAIDQLGNTSTYVYDVLNRKTQSVDARGGIVTLTYDANNNLLSLTDPVNNLTQWVYDALDRKTQDTDPLGNIATFVYDSGDRLISSIDRNSQQIAYDYDVLNRETGETWYNASGTLVNVLTFTYDANDNLLAAANNVATTTMSYNPLDRTSSVQEPFGTVLTYSYDAANNRTLMQDSFGGITTRVYDALNRVTTLMFGGSGQTPLREDFSYTPRDQVAAQTRYSDLAGTTAIGSSTVTYDGVGRMTNLQHLDGIGVNIANYTNTYDLASRITAETLNGGTQTSYSYDSTNELTNDSVVTYTYDLNGNRTMAGYSTNPANELASDGTWDYLYDKNGNIVSKTNISTGEAFSFGYNNRNQLVTAQNTTTSGVQMQATYVYDAVGQRIEKDVWTLSAGTTTRFAYDGSQIWADMTSSNALQTRYLRGEEVLELLARIVSGTATWLLGDRMGSVRNAVDNTGLVIDTITYDGYGNIMHETSPANGGGYKAFGYRFDNETGWLQPDPSRRIYDPVTGRWISQDPLGLGPDTDPYRYVKNAPTNAIDPSGLAEWKTTAYNVYERAKYALPLTKTKQTAFIGAFLQTRISDDCLSVSARIIFDAKAAPNDIPGGLIDPGLRHLLSEIRKTIPGYSLAKRVKYTGFNRRKTLIPLNPNPMEKYSLPDVVEVQWSTELGTVWIPPCVCIRTYSGLLGIHARDASGTEATSAELISWSFTLQGSNISGQISLKETGYGRDEELKGGNIQPDQVLRLLEGTGKTRTPPSFDPVGGIELWGGDEERRRKGQRRAKEAEDRLKKCK